MVKNSTIPCKIPLITLSLVPAITSFSINSQSAAILTSLPTIERRHPRCSGLTRISSLNAYGKGSEIWPLTNEEPIQLSASFPGGVVPQVALDVLHTNPSLPQPSTAANPASSTSALSENLPPLPTTGRKRRAVRRTLTHLLTSAARASSRRASSKYEKTYLRTYGVPPPAMDMGPALLALGLLGIRCVEGRYIGMFLGLSLYLVGLASWCGAPSGAVSATNKNLPNMPSLPAKGHVPSLIANPLGSSLTNSFLYRSWLRLGALLGLLLPTISLGWFIFGGRSLEHVTEIRRLVGGPMFLICCQALTEALARTALLPLPIRILIPVCYNTVRLSSLHPWAFPSSPSVSIPNPIRALGIANLFYWYANLFLFLIPIGVIRYLRAHFYCVEAAEVTVRKGGEGSVGLLS